MAREDIRAARCPLCGGSASLRLSTNGLTYLAMDCCKAQLFSRGPDSDELLRALPEATPAPAPYQLPPDLYQAQRSKPAAPAAEPATPPPTPKEPEPAPARPRMGWGAFPNA